MLSVTKTSTNHSASRTYKEMMTPWCSFPSTEQQLARVRQKRCRQGKSSHSWGATNKRLLPLLWCLCSGGRAGSGKVLSQCGEKCLSPWARNIEMQMSMAGLARLRGWATSLWHTSQKTTMRWRCTKSELGRDAPPHEGQSLVGSQVSHRRFWPGPDFSERNLVS